MSLSRMSMTSSNHFFIPDISEFKGGVHRWCRKRWQSVRRQVFLPTPLSCLAMESDTFKLLFRSNGTDHLHTLPHRPTSPQAQFSQATGYHGSRWLPNDSSHVRQLAPHNKKWNVQLISVVYNSYFYQLKPPFEMLRTLFAMFLSKAQRSWKPSQNYIKCPKAFAWMKWLRQDLL